MYTDPVDCKYRITPPKDRRVKTIQLTFLYMDILNSDCSSDSVIVYRAGRTTRQNRLTRFCGGAQSDTVVTTRRSQMTVVFTGHTPNIYRGFLASVQFL